MLPPLAAAEPTPLKTISLKVTLSFETELSAKPASSTHRASAVRTLSSTCYSPLLTPSPGIINEHTVDPALFLLRHHRQQKLGRTSCPPGRPRRRQQERRTQCCVPFCRNNPQTTEPTAQLFGNEICFRRLCLSVGTISCPSHPSTSAHYPARVAKRPEPPNYRETKAPGQHK